MTWEPELEELRRREALARELGGPERVERQHASGRLTVRERIERLFDPGTFHETGALAGSAGYGADGELESFVPANMVVGTGRIEGRRRVVQADDFTVRGGGGGAPRRPAARGTALAASSSPSPPRRWWWAGGGSRAAAASFRPTTSQCAAGRRTPRSGRRWSGRSAPRRTCACRWCGWSTGRAAGAASRRSSRWGSPTFRHSRASSWWSRT